MYNTRTFWKWKPQKSRLITSLCGLFGPNQLLSRVPREKTTWPTSEKSQPVDTEYLEQFPSTVYHHLWMFKHLTLQTSIFSTWILQVCMPPSKKKLSYRNHKPNALRSFKHGVQFHQSHASYQPTWALIGTQSYPEGSLHIAKNPSKLNMKAEHMMCKNLNMWTIFFRSEISEIKKTVGTAFSWIFS